MGVRDAFDSFGGAGGDVTAGANIGDHEIVRGDGGAKGVKGGANATLDDAGSPTFGGQINIGTSARRLDVGAANLLEVITSGTLRLYGSGSHQVSFSSSGMSMLADILSAVDGAQDLGGDEKRFGKIYGNGRKEAVAATAGVEYVATEDDDFIYSTGGDPVQLPDAPDIGTRVVVHNYDDTESMNVTADDAGSDVITNNNGESPLNPSPVALAAGEQGVFRYVSANLWLYTKF